FGAETTATIQPVINSVPGAFNGACSSGPTGTENFCTAEVQMWGVGVVQEIDAAAMSIWLTYRHLEADVNNVGGIAGVPTEDFQYVKFGALINF
ncbi:MAG: hypothetical protein KAQ88_09255, partial [Hyphomicrobiaceae bacterium]|nr:hypothetical protein [Hyphomicrobiaceae bacterium]